MRTTFSLLFRGDSWGVGAVFFGMVVREGRESHMQCMT